MSFDMHPVTKIEFQIDQRLAGFVATSGGAGEKVMVVYRELLGPDDPLLNFRLSELDKCLFSKIPNLAEPSRIKNLIVTIDSELRCSAYVEPTIQPTVKLNCDKKKGDLIYLNEISVIEGVEMDVKIRPDQAFVAVQSFSWKRSLMFDFGPIQVKHGPRSFDVNRALAHQLQLLFGISSNAPSFGHSRIEQMKSAIAELEDLLEQRCTQESKYQQLLERSPWLLGANYSLIQRHAKMDDANVPDFTAMRTYDGANDIVELKQPFAKLFKSDGSFSSNFNDAWNQAERYLGFCQKQRSYLQETKNLKFDNPRCILLIGLGIDPKQMRMIRAKEEMNRLVIVMTYDQLCEQARHLLQLVTEVNDRTYLPPS